MKRMGLPHFIYLVMACLTIHGNTERYLAHVDYFAGIKNSQKVLQAFAVKTGW